MKVEPVTGWVRAALALFAIGICQASTADEPWRLARDTDGIKVYTRSVVNSRLREFRGEVELAARVEQVVQVLRDANSFRKWMPDVVDSEMLTAAAEEQYHYVESAAPWPVANRDGIYHYRIVRSDDAGSAVTILYIEAVPDYLPRRSGKVRVPRSDGFWKIVTTGNGVIVTYQMHADPGGSIPSWLANRAVVDIPLRTLKNLRTYVADLPP